MDFFRLRNPSEVFIDDCISETLGGFLLHFSIVEALSTNYMGGLMILRLVDYDWGFRSTYASLSIAWILRSLLPNFVLLPLRPLAFGDFFSMPRNSSTSSRPELSNTLIFYYVLLSLFTMRLSILLRLFITFAYIYAVLNSLITLFICSSFLCKSFYCYA